MHHGLSVQYFQFPDGFHNLPYLIGFCLTLVVLDVRSWVPWPRGSLDSVATTL